MKKLIKMMMTAFAFVTGAAYAEDISVGPLMTTKWNQISPYIDFGPVKPDKEEGYDYENHMVNGCVAVAYSQVLKYWGWPEKLEEDVTYTHFANSTHGFTQSLPAGTEFHWDKQLDDYVVTGGRTATQAEMLYLGLGQVFTAMMTEMKFNLTMSGVNLERAVDNPYFYSGDLVNTVGQKTLAMCEDEARESIVGGMPLIMGVEIDYEGSAMAHAIVADGWQQTGSSTPLIHCNYGWGGDSRDKFYTFGFDTSRFIANHKPRPMVVIDPVPSRAALPVKVTWHFPKKGYEQELKGFKVNAYKVTDTTETWIEDFENPQGQAWGEAVTVGELADCGNTGKMLQFTTDSSRDHYSWPTLFLGTGSELSFRVRSDHVRSHQTAWVEAYEANRGWKKIHDIALYETPLAENGGWTNVTVKLDSSYANKAVGFRFRTARAANGDSWSGSGAFGIQIDDVKVTNVYKTDPEPAATETVGRTSRAAVFSDGLSVGERYVFVVEPDVEKGVKSNGTGTMIVEQQPDAVRFYGVQSIRDGDPQFDAENIYREAYLGTNQFAVFGTSNMTKLRTLLSQTSLIDFYWEKDAASSDPNAMIGSSRPVSVANAVKVECKEPGKFLVTIDFSNCTKALRYTREIVTLEGEDEFGNIVRKNLILLFSRDGNEKAIAVSALPAYKGSTTPAAEDESPVMYDVSFDANGGTGSCIIPYESGSVIGTFPSVTRDEYEFAGWYTQAEDGDEVTQDRNIEANVTYYAHWTQRDNNVCIVTFDAGTVVVEREVTIGDEVGPLPNDLAKDGFTLEGWYADTEYTEKVSADRIVSESITFYAHWVEGAGGDDEPSGGDEPTGQNEFTEGGKTYRFCVGVNKTSGFKDVSRNGTSSYKTPGAYNLVLWWADAYKTANGDYPTGYSAPSTNPVQSDFTDFDLKTFASDLFASAVSAAYPNAADRAVYFPATSYTAAEWHGDTSGDAAVKVTGRRIFAELVNGPIGIMVPTSANRTYGAVIWGCEYAEDADGKYATVIYFTSPRVNNSDLESATLGMVTVSGVDTQPGLKGFNTTAGGLIQTYYPIVGPAGKQEDEPKSKTFTIVFDSDGGTPFNARSVVEGGTINPLPQPTKSGFTFDGWFCGDEELKTDTEITAGKTYKAKWTAISAPTIDDDPDAQVAGDAESGFTVTPSATAKIIEVTIPAGIAATKVTVQVGTDVEKITPHGATVKIVKNGHDITDYLDVPGEDGNGAIDLTKATVKAEIMKEPLDAAKGAAVTLEPSKVQIQTANTRPGLTYTLKEGTSILDMKAGDSKIGDGEPWSPTITVSGGTSGFYSIVVEK